MNKRNSGFTLIELMVVVAIVAILSAIAYPSYQEQVRKGRRTDATGSLQEYAHVLERCHTSYKAYNNANCSIVKAGGTALEDGLKSSDGFYFISATTLNASQFALQASPVDPLGTEPNTPQFYDKKCRTFTLSHTGAKTALDDSGNDKAEICWKK